MAIVGAGYAGLSCALELAKQGLRVAVLEADVPGIGASTLSGGQVSGGVNVGRRRQVRSWMSSVSEERQRRLLGEASVSYEVFENILRDNAIECSYVKAGRINAMWTDARTGRLAQAHRQSERLRARRRTTLSPATNCAANWRATSMRAAC